MILNIRLPRTNCTAWECNGRNWRAIVSDTDTGIVGISQRTPATDRLPFNCSAQKRLRARVKRHQAIDFYVPKLGPFCTYCVVHCPNWGNSYHLLQYNMFELQSFWIVSPIYSLFISDTNWKFEHKKTLIGRHFRATSP